MLNLNATVVLPLIVLLAVAIVVVPVWSNTVIATDKLWLNTSPLSVILCKPPIAKLKDIASQSFEDVSCKVT